MVSSSRFCASSRLGHEFSLHACTASCIGITSLTARLQLIALAPLAVLLVAFVAAQMWGWARRRSGTDKSPPSVVPFTLVWTFLLYPSLSSKGFRVLAGCECFSNFDGTRDCFLRSSSNSALLR